MSPSRRSSPGIATKLLTAAVVTLVMLGILEVVVRVAIPVRHVGPAFSVYDPTKGKRLRANFTATRITPEFSFELRTNSLATRDPEPAEPPSGGVVFIGDSFTLGYGVEGHETFSALIRQRLHGAGIRQSVVNLGIGNTGNGRWLKLLEREVPRIRPRVIVLQVMSNDFRDNQRERLYRLDDGGTLVELPIAPPGFGRKLQAVVEAVPGLSYSYLAGLAWTAASGQGLAFTGAPPAPAGGDDPRDALTHALIDEAVKRSKALGAEVVVLLVEVEGARRSKLLEVLDKYGVRHLDAPTKRDAPDLYYRVDGHWNARGHVAAADLLEPVLRELL